MQRERRNKNAAADLANRASAAPEEEARNTTTEEHPTVASPDPRRWYRERGRVSSHVGWNGRKKTRATNDNELDAVTGDAA